jgi:hypothetical protein
MYILSCAPLYHLLIVLCISLIGSFLTGLQLYTGRGAAAQQIAPPNSTLPHPRDLTLRSIALGIGSNTYQCQATGHAELQSSFGIAGIALLN